MYLLWIVKYILCDTSSMWASPRRGSGELRKGHIEHRPPTGRSEVTHDARVDPRFLVSEL
jgi:hypothetical protein